MNTQNEKQTNPTSVEARMETPNSQSPWVNIVILVGAVVLLVGGVFLYVKFNGASVPMNGNVKAEETSIQLEGQRADVREGDVAPNFTLSDISGKSVQLADFKGKPTLVVFEASWCTYCRAQNANIEKLKKDFEGKIHVVSVDMKEDLGSIQNTWESRQNSRLVLADTDGSVGASYGVSGTPTNIFLNSNLEVVTKHPGLMTYDQLTTIINQLIAS